mgnify:CR=1 FL=1
MPRLVAKSTPPPPEAITRPQKPSQPPGELIPSNEIIARLADLKAKGINVYSMTVKRKGCAVFYILSI